MQIIRPAEVAPETLHRERPMSALRGMRIIIASCKSSHDELIGSLHERCVFMVPAWFREHFRSTLIVLGST
jgi:hypothetical protein